MAGVARPSYIDLVGQLVMYQLTLVEAGVELRKLQEILNRQLTLTDMSAIKKACGVFEKLENDKDSPDKTELLRKINEVCYQFLVKKNKISWYSWDCYFGPSYFKQLNQVLQKNAAEYEVAIVLSAAAHHSFIW